MGGFAPLTRAGIRVNVTETANLTLELQLEGVTDTVQVSAAPEIVQSKSNTLGRVVDSRAVEGLPLVTRNFTQIIGLSPGITSDVTDAGSPGPRDRRHVAAKRPRQSLVRQQLPDQRARRERHLLAGHDQRRRARFRTPTPSRSSRFRPVSTTPPIGRNAGANVNLVTKSGSNQFRGSAFEFFRDRSLNANSFFSNRNGQPKPMLDQNQFGFTLGGPVVRDRLLFFGSYQGTRQTNGVSSLVTVLAPPLTDDRSAAAIGRLFAGQRGLQQNAMGGVGPAILADGSNINPVALRLLQMRLADGSYLIPTPQRVNPAAAFAVQGSSTFSTPSSFDENQYMANVDYVASAAPAVFPVDFSPRLAPRSRRFPQATCPGFPLTTDDRYVATLRLAQLGDELAGSSTKRGLATACCRPTGRRTGAFRFSDVGIQSAPQNDDLPTIAITGSYTLGSSAIGTRSQRTFLFEDSLSWVLGNHNLQVGGGFTQGAARLRGLPPAGRADLPELSGFSARPECGAERHQPVQQRVRLGRSHRTVRSRVAELGDIRVHPGQLSACRRG